MSADLPASEAPGEPIDPRTLDRPWRIWASAAILTVLILGAAVGLFVLPGLQGRNAGLDLWSSFCRAIGVTAGTPAQRQPPHQGVAVPVSQVQWGTDVLQVLANGRPERGARLAGEVCAACHGEDGVAATPELPSLAGQSSAAIYKQLSDYRSGARVHPQMTPVAKQLIVPNLADLAVYYGRHGDAYQALGLRDQPGDAEIVRLATRGDPSRRIAACNSCHVNGSGGPIETPVLTGQNAAYLAAQLHRYKSGERQNDVYGRMRTISKRLTPEEIEGLARYYQGVL